MEKCSTVKCDIVILITTPIFQQPRNRHPSYYAFTTLMQTVDITLYIALNKTIK